MLNELINEQWSMVVIALVFLAIAVLYYFGKKKEVAIIALELIKIAEELVLGSGKGDEKLSLVYRSLYPTLPKIIRFIWSQEDVYFFIDYIFETNKELLLKYTAE